MMGFVTWIPGNIATYGKYSSILRVHPNTYTPLLTLPIQGHLDYFNRNFVVTRTTASAGQLGAKEVR